MGLSIESFESIAITSNSPLHPTTSHFIKPGFTGSFTFPSTLRLTAPVPNNTLIPSLVVGDFLRASYNLDLGINGAVTAGDVPTGAAYLAFFGNTELSMAFDTPVYQVGAYVDSHSAFSPGIAAYGANGQLISGAQIRSVAVADWDQNYVQVLSKVPIAKVVFTGSYIVVDDVSFDSTKPKIVKGTNDDDKLSAIGPAGASPSNNAELINGRKGDDKINGKGGDDTIDGGKGDDKIRGGDGNDTIMAGNGDDRIRGDGGQDSYVFTQLGDVTQLKDFTVFDDTILLSRAVFTGLVTGPLLPSQVRLGAAAADPDDRLIYDPTTGLLSFDGDGNGTAAAAVVFAKLPVNLAVNERDFLVV